MASSGINLRQLVLVPAVITFAVTLVRLVGEINRWSPALLNLEPGGGGTLIGIAWLPFIFGIYFALKLVKMGHGPSSAGRAILYFFLGLVAMAGIAVVVILISNTFAAILIAGVLGAAAALFIAGKGWPALFKTLFAYALAARIPVAIVMLIAIFAEWGTHYEFGPPNTPAMGPFVKWIMIGVVPQMTSWIGYTVVVGGLFGGIAAALAGKSTEQAAHTA